MNIYLVDDSFQFRQAIRTYITKVLGHKVIGEADDGLEFLQKYRYNNDIILMDINMPVINGLKAVKRAFERDARVKAIAVTMSIDELRLEQLIDTGFKACILKARLVEELSDVLEKVNMGELYFPEKN